MTRVSPCLLIPLLVAAGCGGESKNYGDPIESEVAQQSAGAAIDHASVLTSSESWTAPLTALNAVSGSYNVMAGAKLQAEYEDDYGDLMARVADAQPLQDDDCATMSASGIVYDDCDFNGVAVDGSITYAESDVSIDLTFDDPDPELSVDIRIRGEIAITETYIAGGLDFRLDISVEGDSARAELNGDFDIELVDGCAVGGELEVNVKASAQGQSESTWVKAEYGPACGEVIIR